MGCHRCFFLRMLVNAREKRESWEKQKLWGLAKPWKDIEIEWQILLDDEPECRCGKEPSKKWVYAGS